MTTFPTEPNTHHSDGSSETLMWCVNDHPVDIGPPHYAISDEDKAKARYNCYNAYT